MHVILLGGPDHGKRLELPPDQASVEVPNLSDGSKNRYSCQPLSPTSPRPLIWYFFYDGLPVCEVERLGREAGPNA